MQIKNPIVIFPYSSENCYHQDNKQQQMLVRTKTAGKTG
jgi:hypothetical protein